MVVVNARGGTQAVYYDPSAPAITAVVSGGSMATYYQPSEPTVKVKTGETIAVYFDPATPSVAATFSGSIATYFDPAEPTIKGITETIRIGDIPGTVAVYFSPANPSVAATLSAASLEVIPTTGSRIMYDEAHQAQRVLIVGSQTVASMQVVGITNSIAVHLLSTAGTLGVNVDINEVVATDDTTTHTSGTTKGAIIMAVATPTDTEVDANDYGALRMTTDRRMTTEDTHTNDIKQAVEIMDDWDESNRAKVNPIVGQAGVSADSGVTGALTQRVVHAVDVGQSVNIIAVDTTDTLGVHLVNTGGTLGVNVGTVADTVTVRFDPGYELGSIKGVNSTVQVNVGTVADTVTVRLDPGYEIGSVKAINTTVQVDVGKISDTISVMFSPSKPTVKQEKASSGSYNNVEIVTFARQIVAANANRISVVIINPAASTLYVGLDNSVTTANLGNGFPLIANQSITFDDYTGAIFGALEAGDINAKYIEV